MTSGGVRKGEIYGDYKVLETATSDRATVAVQHTTTLVESTMTARALKDLRHAVTNTDLLI